MLQRAEIANEKLKHDAQTLDFEWFQAISVF